MARFKIVSLFIATLLVASSLAVAQEVCPPEGSPKPGSTQSLTPPKIELNRYKNRTNLPSQVQPVTVPDVLKLPGDTHGWDRSIEQRGVVLDGFLLGFKHEGPESPNCYSDVRRDFHMWIGAAKPTTNADTRAMRAEAVVVEPTPAMQDSHPSWTEQSFLKLVGQHVRITGWLMFDPEHPDQLGKTRGTLWEVHPAMKIEVQRGGGWVEF